MCIDFNHALPKEYQKLSEGKYKDRNANNYIPTNYGGCRITNVGEPENPSDAATKHYVDQQIANSKGEVEDPMFTFSVISDLHLTDKNNQSGYDDLVNLLKILGKRITDKNLNLKYICCCGDIGTHGYEFELQTFHQIIAAKCPISKDRVFACNGNHDQQRTYETWVNEVFDPSLHPLVTQDKNFAITDGNFVFAFMSLAYHNDTSTSVDRRICYLDDTQTNTKSWLENIVNISRNKTLFLFMHYPLQNRRCYDRAKITMPIYEWSTGEYVDKEVYIASTAEQWAGLPDLGGQGNNNVNCSNYGFYLPSAIQNYDIKLECENIIDILNNHVGGKTIVFSGHTHLTFQTEDYNPVLGKGFPNINVGPVRLWDNTQKKYNLTNIVTVHTPSLNQPRKFNSTSLTSGITGWSNISSENTYRQPVQSWLVDVYNDKIILKGFETQVSHDCKYGDILNNYIYTIDLTDII